MRPELTLPSPVQEIHDERLTQDELQLFIKRDDLIDKNISGNKWRKLQFYLERAKFEKKETLLTFGGAFSNHIAATAAAGNRLGFKTIGIIRGEIPVEGNATLDFARSQGMELHAISRTDYRLKGEPEFIAQLRERFGSFYLIPEGGAGHLGVSGCVSILKEVEEHFDVVILACGTATTLAGVVLCLNENQKAIGVSALKNGAFLKEEALNGINKVLLDQEVTDDYADSFHIETDYAFGGYAKMTPELLQFMRDFNVQHQIQLDPVYTAKALYAFFDLVEKRYFKAKTRVLFIHSGGLQGIAGMELKIGEPIYPT